MKYTEVNYLVKPQSTCHAVHYTVWHNWYKFVCASILNSEVIWK